MTWSTSLGACGWGDLPRFLAESPFPGPQHNPPETAMSSVAGGVLGGQGEAGELLLLPHVATVQGLTILLERRCFEVGVVKPLPAPRALEPGSVSHHGHLPAGRSLPPSPGFCCCEMSPGQAGQQALCEHCREHGPPAVRALSLLGHGVTHS